MHLPAAALSDQRKAPAREEPLARFETLLKPYLEPRYERQWDCART